MNTNTSLKIILAFSVLFSFLIVLDRISVAPGIKIDFSSFIYGAEVLAENGDLYSRDALQAKSRLDQHVYPYIYTPVLALILSPFSSSNIYSVQLIWTILSIIAFAFCLYLSFVIIYEKINPVNLPFKDLLYAVFIILFLALALPYRYIIYMGQVDPFILLFIILSLHYFSRGKYFMAGALIGVAAMLKITPLFFILFYVAKGKFKTLTGLTVSTLSIFLVSLLFIDLHYWFDFLKFFLNNATGSEIDNLAGVADLHNSSVTGFWARIAGTVSDIYKYLSYTTLIILYVLIIVITRKYANVKNEYAAVILFLIMLIIVPPIAWRQHIIYILPGIMFLVWIFYKEIESNHIKIFAIIATLFLTGIAGLDAVQFLTRIIGTTDVSPLFIPINLYALLGLMAISIIYIISKFRNTYK